MNQDNATPEDLDRYFPDFKNDSVNSESENPTLARSKKVKSQKNSSNLKIEPKEGSEIFDRFFLYIFCVSVALGFLGTVIPKKSIERTINVESGDRIEIVTSKQGDTFTQVVGYSLASLAAIMGSIKKLVSN